MCEAVFEKIQGSLFYTQLSPVYGHAIQDVQETGWNVLMQLKKIRLK